MSRGAKRLPCLFLVQGVLKVLMVLIFEDSEIIEPRKKKIKRLSRV